MKLLTAREVGALLAVSTETVLRWTRRGELPAIRLPGGAVRFRQDVLEDWLASRAQGGLDQAGGVGSPDNINGAAPLTRPAPGDDGG